MFIFAGGSSIAVPGEVKGLWELHQQFGQLPWADLVQPSIDIAINGFPITKSIAAAIQSFGRTAAKHKWFDMSPLR